MLDDGRITDSQGRTVDFKNTIIILTSNLGSDFILEGIDGNGQITPEAKEQVQSLLTRSFRPEFLNRLDEIVFYKPLTKAEISSIVDLLVADLNRRLEDKHPDHHRIRLRKAVHCGPWLRSGVRRAAFEAVRAA